MLGVGVQVCSIREGRGGPDGKLSGVEALSEIATNIGTGRDVLGEVGGRLTSNLLPEVVGFGNVWLLEKRLLVSDFVSNGDGRISYRRRGG